MLLFFILFIAAWVLIIFTQATFPNQTVISYFVRISAAVIAVLLMIVGNNRLLEKSNIPKEALGLKLCSKSFINFILGGGIGMTVIILIGLILYAFVPFHFITGSLKGMEVLKEAHSYFWGNFFEELTFRGFPLIVVSRLLGWRKAAWIMALPFGLSHLIGLGLPIEGLKMVITTATYSFIFTYAFILTGTLWTAIGAHVISNILLHSVSGLDGQNKAMLQPIFETKWPADYDPGIISFVLGSIIISIILFMFIKKRFDTSSSK
ncbi:type II CAAX endopeptidase family protein [Algoriphagus sp. C2-6-M1]|uniref:CPBP family intramembrane glutamic endopeptidase n=1 Tax=Algoriphagus persicinus TaxID=3108754 RepID=UPI002B3B26BE|nr:type II CAAX endopeptidase family protein [Algoriphagus sp. C2-6-M1]MEB2782629.1 type II CAAX endopeptidase family protein [Algoriphagus sp. C2-6-M1]